MKNYSFHRVPSLNDPDIPAITILDALSSYCAKKVKEPHFLDSLAVIILAPIIQLGDSKAYALI